MAGGVGVMRRREVEARRKAMFFAALFSDVLLNFVSGWYSVQGNAIYCLKSGQKDLRRFYAHIEIVVTVAVVISYFWGHKSAA